MSSDDLSSLVSTLYQSNICTLSATALLLYDWALTLDRESRLVWSQRKGPAGLLYMLGRLVTPISYLASMLLWAPVSDERCRQVILAEQVTGLLPYVFWGVFSSFRAHALSARNWALAATVLLLALVPVGLNSYIYYYSQAANYAPPIGCEELYDGPNTSTVFISIISYCSRGSIVLAECIVIVLTWREAGLSFSCSAEHGQTSVRSVRKPRSIRDVLFLNGSVCFGASLAMNALTLGLLGAGDNADQAVELFAYFRDAITSILASRFLLDLLELGCIDDNTSEDSGAILSTQISGGFFSSGLTMISEEDEGAINEASYEDVATSDRFAPWPREQPNPV
ncbi:hypothetical protein FKP32DRAFT_1682629 [Trametes sanguinea]|nr:hypothetical protein FKP32DRAFT_1682629 [Trametes sanguinea]